MPDTVPTNIKSSTGSKPDLLFLAYCKKYIDYYYPNKGKPQKHIINEFDHRDIKFFKIISPSSFDQIFKIIKDDLAKLDKHKIRFHQVIYFAKSALLASELFIQHIKKTCYSKNNSYDFISFPVLITSLSSTASKIDPELFLDSDLMPFYIKGFHKPQRTINIIEEIFDFVYASQNQIQYPTNIKDGLEKLLAKLSINFSGNDHENMLASLSDNWQNKNLVDQYIRDKISAKPSQIFAMLTKVQNEYKLLNPERDTHYPINYFKNVLSIADSIIPPRKNKISEYHACCLAIVLYFFEMCDIGDRTKNEQLSFIEQFRLDGE
ncbi:MAG: hypothetical protein WAU11_15435 [Ignavibacteriaceae bacterium]